MRKCALCSGSRQDPRRRWPSRTAGWAARCGSVAGLARVRPRRSGPAQSGTRPRAPVRARKLVCAPITFTCVVPLLQRLQGVPICATPGSPAPVGTAIELAAASACAPSQGGSYKAAFLSNSVASSFATRLRLEGDAGCRTGYGDGGGSGSVGYRYGEAVDALLAVVAVVFVIQRLGQRGRLVGCLPKRPTCFPSDGKGAPYDDRAVRQMAAIAPVTSG